MLSGRGGGEGGGLHNPWSPFRITKLISNHFVVWQARLRDVMVDSDRLRSREGARGGVASDGMSAGEAGVGGGDDVTAALEMERAAVDAGR